MIMIDKSSERDAEDNANGQRINYEEAAVGSSATEVNIWNSNCIDHVHFKMNMLQKFGT